MGLDIKKTGVIVVDIQGDFTTWKRGALAVEGTDGAYIKSVEHATRTLKEKGCKVYATQDWHPPDHVSFYTNHPGKNPFDVIDVNGRKQVLWPPHCVMGTYGAEILIENKLFDAIVKKGQDPHFDSYSGFQDDGGKKTEMDEVLRASHIEGVILFGLATDYCVFATAKDAKENGYRVVFIEGLSRGVGKDTTRNAIKEMKDMGIRIIEGLDIENINAL
ncbi:MAG: isochorismatase family protein [Syntrophorhabdaceae bacterium]|nr:isochorismatase family protein [Syntrophorhabdaceae bacterium]